jgi:hypothetical protein
MRGALLLFPQVFPWHGAKLNTGPSLCVCVCVCVCVCFMCLCCESCIVCDCCVLCVLCDCVSFMFGVFVCRICLVRGMLGGMCIMLGGIPVPTAWRVLELRMEERPPDMEVSCEYIE